MSSNIWKIPQYLAKDRDKWLKLVVALCPTLSVEENYISFHIFVKSCTKFDIEFKESKYGKEYVPTLTKRPTINLQPLLPISKLFI